MSKRSDPKTIYLGSGKAYIAEYDAAKGLPDIDTICVDKNLLGKIKSGATLVYNDEKHDESDDLGTVMKSVVTKETASLKLGLITFNGNTLAYLADRCKVTEKDGKRTVLIGGYGNSQGKEWVVCFAHEDKKDGNVWVMVRGTNQAGLSLSYAVDAGTKIEPEIRALPFDDNGSLISYTEEIGEAAAAAE